MERNDEAPEEPQCRVEIFREDLHREALSCSQVVAGVVGAKEKGHPPQNRDPPPMQCQERRMGKQEDRKSCCSGRVKMTRGRQKRVANSGRRRIIWRIHFSPSIASQEPSSLWEILLRSSPAIEKGEKGDEFQVGHWRPEGQSLEIGWETDHGCPEEGG